MIDLEWRQAVCRQLSAQVDTRNTANQILARLLPVLQALYPRPEPVPRNPLKDMLEELVSLTKFMKVEKDIYVSFFPTTGSALTTDDIVRGNQTGRVWVCTFPGLARRYWDEQQAKWYHLLLTPAVVELESALHGE